MQATRETILARFRLELNDVLSTQTRLVCMMVMMATTIVGCMSTKPASDPRTKPLCASPIAQSTNLTRKVCTIQGPEVATKSMVLAPEGNYLVDVLKHWEAGQQTQIASRVIESRSAIERKLEAETRSKGDGSSAPNSNGASSGSTPGEQQEKKELDNIKNFLKKLEKWSNADGASGRVLADQAKAFWPEDPNVPGNDRAIKILGENQSKWTLDYLKARSVDNKLQREDEQLLQAKVNQAEIQKNSQTLDRIRAYIVSPTPSNENVAKVNEFGKPLDRLYPLFSASLIHACMTDPSIKEKTINLIRDDISKLEKGSASQQPPKTGSEPMSFPPAIASSTFFERHPEFVAILRRANGLQYAADVTDIFTSPIGGIHVDDSDTITLLRSEHLFGNDEINSISFQRIQDASRDDETSNVAVIAMPVLGRLTEVLVPIATTRSSSQAWIPLDAVISMQNFGQVPIITASRRLMELRLRGESDVILNEKNEICRLFPENSPLANRLEPVRDRIDSARTATTNAWSGWGVPSILR